MIGPWVAEQAKRQIAERNSQHLHKAQRPGAQVLTLRETHVQNAVSTNDQQTPCGIF
jgi:hypothetical protein